MRVKSPFSHRALFGFIGSLPFVRTSDRNLAPAHRRSVLPCAAHEYTPSGDQEHDRERSEDQPVGAGRLCARIAVRREQRGPEP